MPSGVYSRKPARERFLACVRVERGHWMWTASTSGGYGAFWSGGWIGAHVFAYTEFVGPIPIGHQIRHTCDIKLCVAPKHLITGTAKDNAGDREARSRHLHLGTHNKLTNQQAAELRSKYGQRKKFDKPSLEAIGREYGISAPSVCWLLKGHTYRREVVPI